MTRRACCIVPIVAIIVFVLLPSAHARAQAGWRALNLGPAGRATRYVPTTVRTCDPLPMLLFLHGAGGTPEAYAPHLEPHAEALGLVLLLPQSSGSSGWSGGDAAVLNAALDALEAEVNVDASRTYLGGHSAGGAFAYLLTYDSAGVAAVLSMSAPFYTVSAVADPDWTAPIRMYYGDMDPNYTGGSAAALEAQWARLGVRSELDVQAGFGHSTWPASSIRAGLEFLLAVRRPGPATPSRCAETDAGLPSTDASTTIDAATQPDAGPFAAEDTGALDASVPRDMGMRRSALGSGCSRRVGSGTAPARSPSAPLGVGLILLLLGRGTLRAQCSRAHWLRLLTYRDS
ncbi:MAG: hypothetical protein OHK0013_06950 [Sandaracinaceae bacterium]